MTKIISVSLSSNTQRDDIKLAQKLLFRGGRGGEEILEKKFKELFGQKHCFAFNSGRTAFLAILQALKIGENDEVLIQAFTCVALVNPILLQKATAIFCDINETLNMDVDDLKNKITKRTKAIVVQHTFGWPDNMERIKKIAQENHLFLIEDCSHSLGAKYQGRHCGTFGDASFFSFGRDKIISAVFGGMACASDAQIAGKLKNFQQTLKYPSFFWTCRQLLHPILIHGAVLPLYNFFGLGKLILVLLQRFRVLSKTLKKQEKQGIMKRQSAKRMPGKLADLASHQLGKIREIIAHRQGVADFYFKVLKNSDFILPFSRDLEGREAAFLKYPVLTAQRSKDILEKAKKENILLDDGWRESPVMPPDVNLEKIGYRRGSCPAAEKIAEAIVSLPTHINITRQDVQRIVGVLIDFGEGNNFSTNVGMEGRARGEFF